MASRITSTVTFDAEKVIQPIYTGGDVSIDSHGHYLVTCLGDQAVVTDFQNGELLIRIDGDGEPITALKLTPDSQRLIICWRSSSMGIYAFEQSDKHLDAVLQRNLKPFATPVVSLSVDVTSTLLATGSSDGSIKVWDIRGGFVTHTFRGHTGVVSALKLFMQSSGLDDRASTQEQPGRNRIRLASGGEDGKVRIWDLSKKKAYAVLDSHVSMVRSIDFSVEQNALITGSRDKTIAIWDGQAWKPRKIIPAMEATECVGFIAKGELFYSGGETGRIRIWNTDTGQEITEAQKAHRGTSAIVGIQCCHLDSILLCVRSDQMLETYNLGSLSEGRKQAKISSVPTVQRISGTHDEVIDFAFVSTGHKLMALATNTEDLKLISISNDASPRSVDQSSYFGADVALLKGHEDIIICLDVDWSGQWIATGAKDNTARLWYVDHIEGIFNCFAVYKGHAGSIGAVAVPQSEPPKDSVSFSKPALHPPSFLVTGSQDQTVKRWNITQDNDISSESSHSRAIYTRKAHDKDINALAINHDSSLFASASQDRLVKIWSTEEGQVQGVLRGHKRGVWSVKFAPRGTPPVLGDAGSASSKRGLILTGSGDKSVKIWSLSDYSCLRMFEGHTNSVLKVVWFPPPEREGSTTNRGHLVASAGGDGLVKVWDPRFGECVSTLDNHTERVWALAASPELDYLISGGGDGVVTFWADTTVATLENAAAASTARIEQEQELSNHIHLGRYRDAIVLALQLNHPARLLALFNEVAKRYPQEPGSLSGVKDVDDVIADLSDEQLYTLLLRIRDWNTNAKTAHVAQRILWVIFKTFPASRLVTLQKRGRGLKDILEGLQAYTERHYRRTEELLEESYLVDFVVAQMGEEGYVEDEPWRINGHSHENDGHDRIVVD
jgi:U3 small nucleolar RNA-associated protein 13